VFVGESANPKFVCFGFFVDCRNKTEAI
jgi:hypothetical protein